MDDFFCKIAPDFQIILDMLEEFLENRRIREVIRQRHEAAKNDVGKIIIDAAVAVWLG